MKKQDMENYATAFLVHTLHFLEVFDNERQHFSNKIHQHCSPYGHPKANRQNLFMQVSSPDIQRYFWVVPDRFAEIEG